MYRILVVDDEDFITDSLAYMLETTSSFELDVYKAYSARGALDYLNKYAFDLVVTDVEMPGMTGIGLLKEISDKWPGCKVIFLTGHDSFEFAREAIKYRVSRYVLKNEGDDVLLSAIDACISEINQETNNPEVLSGLEIQESKSHPMPKRDFLRTILMGEPSSNLHREFERLSISFNSSGTVMILAARIAAADKTTASMVDLILQEKIGHIVQSELVWEAERCIMWMLQPQPDQNFERVQVTVKGMAESIQRVCETLLNIGITFVLDTHMITWKEIYRHFTMLKHIVELRLNENTSMAIASIEYFLGEPIPLIDQKNKTNYKDVLQKLALNTSCNVREVEHYCDLLQSIVESETSENRNKINLLELNTELRLILLSYVTKHEIQEKIQDDAAFIMFLNEVASMDTSFYISLFRLLITSAISLCEPTQNKTSEAFVDYLLSYINENLHSDLSLCRLSEKVYLNPSYLSRRFKELTGKTLIDTITEIRINKACALLKDNNIKITKIVALVGYESPAHFSRIFKRHIGVSPQEYRDN